MVMASSGFDGILRTRTFMFWLKRTFLASNKLSMDCIIYNVVMLDECSLSFYL